MVTVIDENEVGRLLEMTETLISACKKNNTFSKAEIKDMEDYAYYFKKAFKNGEFAFESGACCHGCDDDLDDDLDDDDW